MQIPFNDLLRMAAEQKQPQRLLFVFATRDIREGHENLDDPDFAIIPQMYTDKTLEYINAFADLANEAHEADCTWDLLLILMYWLHPPWNSLLQLWTQQLSCQIYSLEFWAHLSSWPFRLSPP